MRKIDEQSLANLVAYLKTKPMAEVEAIVQFLGGLEKVEEPDIKEGPPLEAITEDSAPEA